MISAIIVEDEDGDTRTIPVCVFDLIDIGKALDQEHEEHMEFYMKQSQKRQNTEKRKKAKAFVKEKLSEIMERK